MIRGQAAGVFFLAPAVILPAQTSATLKVETRVVQINVAVKDAQGRPVRGLRQEDFIITDNGNRREIRMFASEDEPAPRSSFLRMSSPTGSATPMPAAASDAIVIRWCNGKCRPKGPRRRAASCGSQCATLFAMGAVLLIVDDEETIRQLP